MILTLALTETFNLYFGMLQLYLLFGSSVLLHSRLYLLDVVILYQVVLQEEGLEGRVSDSQNLESLARLGPQQIRLEVQRVESEVSG